MAWRKAAAGPAADAVAELAGYAEEYAAAAARGDAGAAVRLGGVLSWMDMIRVSGGEPEVAELFLGFARDDRAWLHGGVAQAGG